MNIKLSPFMAFLIFQSLMIGMSSSYAKDKVIGGFIASEKMGQYCTGKAQILLNELHGLNADKIKLINGEVNFVEDNERLDAAERRYKELHKVYNETLLQIDNEYKNNIQNDSTIDTNTKKDVLLHLKSNVSNIANAQSESLAETLNFTTQLNPNKFFPFTPVNLGTENKLSLNYFRARMGDNFTFKKYSTDEQENQINERYQSIKSLVDFKHLPEELRPAVIKDLFGKTSPRTLELLGTNNSLEVIYECLNTSTAAEQCTFFLRPNETLDDLRKTLASEDDVFKTQFKNTVTTEKLYDSIKNVKKSIVTKETITQAVELIKEQLESEKKLNDQPDFVIDGTANNATASNEEKRIQRMQNETAGKSSLFLLLFDGKSLSSAAATDNDYEFNKKLQLAIEQTDKEESTFSTECMYNMKDENLQYCAKIVLQSEEKLEALKNNYLTRNRESVERIKKLDQEKDFQSIENLKGLLHTIYKNECNKAQHLVSQDVQCTPQLHGTKKIDDLFKDSKSILSKIDVDRIARKDSIDSESHNVLKDACEFITKESAPETYNTLCITYGKGGRLDQYNKKVEERKIVADNKRERYEKDYHFEYDPKTGKNKAIKKQSWAMIAGKGIVPVLPYTVSQGMGIYQNKYQTQSLLSSGLMQKQLLHNMNYSWKYPINSFTNPFLFGTTNGVYNYQFYNTNILQNPSSIGTSFNSGISTGFNFGN